MRIWDFRRGDDDDNRTSPHGGSLRRMLVSAALEFNYAKAAIGFLVLIVGPALLVGIVPSVVVTYGRLKFGAATSVGEYPIVAVIVLGVLAAAALWIGRPLLPKAIENFWHLHYTLVFPVFVAVREVLRSIAERFSGETGTAEQLDRRRRMGTVLGALLFAGGGVILAVTVDLSIGLQLVDVERVRPWAVARAALGNAAVVLGVSTAAESLYWVWRELGFRGRVLDWAPSPLEPATPTGRVAHLSDLHFVGERYGCRMESGTHGPRGNRCIRRALRKLTAIHASRPLDRILVTGDITDAGTRAEWAEFIDLFRNYPELRARTSFVPGNHDVNIVDRNNRGAIRFAREREPVATQAPRGSCPGRTTGQPRPPGGPRVRRARTIATRLPARRRARGTPACAGATRCDEWPPGDVEGLGRDLPAGRTSGGRRWVRTNPSQFECTQPLLAHECDRRGQSIAVESAQVGTPEFAVQRVDDLAASPGGGVSGGIDQPHRSNRSRAGQCGGRSGSDCAACIALPGSARPPAQGLDRDLPGCGAVLRAVGDDGLPGGNVSWEFPRSRIRRRCGRRYSTDRTERVKVS